MITDKDVKIDVKCTVCDKEFKNISFDTSPVTPVSIFVESMLELRTSGGYLVIPLNKKENKRRDILFQDVLCNKCKMSFTTNISLWRQSRKDKK